MRLSVRTCVVALAALICGVAAATASATSSVQGFIYAQGSNQPLAGVTVEVDSGCGHTVCGSYQTAVSANDGSYAVSGVIAGDVTASAYCPPAGCNYARAKQTITIGDGVSANLDFHLAPGATISGTVRRNSDNAPVEGIAVDLNGATNVNIRGNATTDASGQYSFQQLAAGSYVVAVNSVASTTDIYQTQFYAAHPLTPPSQGDQVFDPIAVSSGQALGGIDFSLIVGAQISGTLTDRYSGLPIANVQATFRALDATAPQLGEWFFRLVETDSLGRYALNGLPDGSIYLGASNSIPYYSGSYYGCSPDPCSDVTHATPLTIAANTMQNVDFSLFPGSVVTGTVTRRSDGQPLANVTVQAFVVIPIFGPGNQLVFGRAKSDAQGHYVMTGGINGLDVDVAASDAHFGGLSYLSQVYHDHNCSSGSCAFDGDKIAPPEFQVTPGVDFQLDAGGAISGQVVRKDGGTGIQSYVTLYSADDIGRIFLDTKPDGTFITSGLAPGTYFLSAQAPGYDCVVYASALCGSGYIPTVGQSIVVAGTQDVTGIVIVLPNETLFSNGFE